MRTEYLRYVVDTAELGSIALAAKKNFISPQGLGRAITVVEDELGFPLFNRSANSLTLTAKGTRIFPAIMKAVQASYQLHEEAMKLAGGDSQDGSVIFCSSIVFMSGMISQLYGDFFDSTHDLRYVQMSTSRIIDTFCDHSERFGELSQSVGIVLFFWPDSETARSAVDRLEARGCAYKPYIEYEDGVLVPESSPLAMKEALTTADVSSMPIISSTAEQRPALEKAFGASSVTMVVPDINFRKRLVRDGRGVTFFPMFLGINQEVEGTRFKPLKDSRRIQLGFVGQSAFFESRLYADLVQSLNGFYAPLAEKGLCKLV